MAIAASAQQQPVVVPNAGIPFVDKNGMLSSTGRLFAQTLRNFVANMNRSIPCNATGKNLISLTLLQIQPEVNQYTSYDDYTFVAAETSDGSVTALVVTQAGSLSALNVYLASGSQAGSGDIVANKFYRFTYVDTLNGGNGGFLVTFGGSVIAPLTDSTTGTPAATLVATADADTNDNFSSLNAKLDAVIAAISS